MIHTHTTINKAKPTGVYQQCTPIVQKGNWCGVRDFAANRCALRQNQQGIALLITMVLLGTIMATALGVAVLVTGEVGITRLASDSTEAIFAADAGMEKMFYACSGKVPYPAPANFTVLDVGNGARYNVCMAAASGGACTDTCNDTWVTGKGTSGSAQRSFEANY